MKFLFKSARKRIKVEHENAIDEKPNAGAKDVNDPSLINKQSSQSVSSLSLSNQNQTQSQMNARNERRSKRTRKCKGDIEILVSSYNTVRQVKALVSV
jgi:hypothetical protein